jgi:hypothetical protein
MSKVFEMMNKKSIVYFSEPGEANTDETLKLAKERADELSIKDMVIATTRGSVATKTLEVFKGCNVVFVTHVTGMKEPGVQELNAEIAKKINANGGKIVTAAHAFSGVNRAIQAKFNTMYPAGIVAQTLRIFGQGMKVVVEVVAMAADAGVIPVDKDVIAIAGSGKGSDTAVVMKPAYSHSLFDMVVREIIAKPSSV